MKETTVKKYVSALENLGYTVSKKVVKATPVTKEVVKYVPQKLEYSRDNLESFKAHFNLNRKVRLNFGKYKNKWISVSFTNYDEFKVWLVANPYRVKHIKSVSLL